VDCDFEKNDLCKWELDDTLLGQWRTGQNATPTSDTGPRSGHGGKGDPLVSSKKRSLISHLI